MSKKRTTNDELLMALSQIVRQRREALRLTQEEVADRAKLHRTYISDIERGARNLSLKSLADLAQALDVSIAELMTSAEGKVKSNNNGTSHGTSHGNNHSNNHAPDHQTQCAAATSG
jgi:transcriptional regulator with XRE-family HTH domain